MLLSQPHIIYWGAGLCFPGTWHSAFPIIETHSRFEFNGSFSSLLNIHEAEKKAYGVVVSQCWMMGRKPGFAALANLCDITLPTLADFKLSIYLQNSWMFNNASSSTLPQISRSHSLAFLLASFCYFSIPWFTHQSSGDKYSVYISCGSCGN